MEDLALLVLRTTFGGFLAGHGAQKLFGWFGGPGRKGTAGWLESLGLKPGQGGPEEGWAHAQGAAKKPAGPCHAIATEPAKELLRAVARQKA
ncbi:MAG: DoxX family protein, partial [Ktedonobacterales bacterium]